jgi:hypothetical protein
VAGKGSRGDGEEGEEGRIPERTPPYAACGAVEGEDRGIFLFFPTTNCPGVRCVASVLG